MSVTTAMITAAHVSAGGLLARVMSQEGGVPETGHIPPAARPQGHRGQKLTLHVETFEQLCYFWGNFLINALVQRLKIWLYYSYR